MDHHQRLRRLKKPIGPSSDPKGVYVGSLREGRECYDHRGRRLTVITQGMGSTLVKQAKPGKTFVAGGKVVVIKATSKNVCISLESVVYTNNPMED